MFILHLLSYYLNVQNLELTDIILRFFKKMQIMTNYINYINHIVRLPVDLFRNVDCDVALNPEEKDTTLEKD